MEPDPARVAPRDNAEVPPQPRRIRSHSRVRNPFRSLQLQQPREIKADPPGRYRPAGCGNQPNWLVADCGSWSKLAARVASLANVEVPPHPGRIGSHPQIRNLSTQTTRGRKRRSPGSIPPLRVWKTQPYWLAVNWQRLMGPDPARVTPRDNIEVPPHPERIISHSRVRNPSRSLQLQPRGNKSISPGSIPPRRVWKPTHMAGC